MTSEWRIYGRILFAVLCVAVLVVVYHWAADKFRAPAIVTTTQQIATTPAGVQAAAKAVHVPLQDQGHATDISRAIMGVSERKPNEVIQTTGSEWEKTVEANRIQNKSDFVMVTDPKRPTELPIIKPADSVTVNAYYVKAYPRQFQQIGYGPPSTIIATANWKVAKTKTKEWYIGVWGTVDYQKPEQSRAGIMFTRM